MARPEDDPSHTFSGDEEDGSSEEISESESEPETDKTTPSTPPATKKISVIKQVVRPTSATPASADSSSSEEDESGSESESDSDLPPKRSGKLDVTVKPISSKPMEIPPKSVTKPRSKPTATSSSPSAKAGSRAKRPGTETETETTESKRAKKKATDAENGAEGGKKANGDDPKKLLFQRLWSEEDEVVILKGMSDYSAKKKADPIADMNDFHDFIKKSLHVDVSRTQLTDKVRRLKKKYVNNSKKGKTGKEKTFSKPHDQVCYDLSKNFWGGCKEEDTSARVDNLKVSGTAKKNLNQRNGNVAAHSEVDRVDGNKEGTAMEIDAALEQFGLVSVGGSIGVRDSADQIIKNGWKLVTCSKRSEWEKKSKKLMVEEVELYSRRLELTLEQVKLVSEAMKSTQE